MFSEAMATSMNWESIYPTSNKPSMIPPTRLSTKKRPRNTNVQQQSENQERFRKFRMGKQGFFNASAKKKAVKKKAAQKKAANAAKKKAANIAAAEQKAANAAAKKKAANIAAAEQKAANAAAKKKAANAAANAAAKKKAANAAANAAAKKKAANAAAKKKAANAAANAAAKQKAAAQRICPSQFIDMNKLPCKRSSLLYLHPDKNPGCEKNATKKFVQFSEIMKKCKKT